MALTVSEIQDKAEILAQGLKIDMDTSLQELLNRSVDSGWFLPFQPDINLRLIDVSGGLSQTTTTINLPTLTSFGEAQQPESPELSDVATPNIPNVPTFDESAPTLNLPTAPSASLPAAPTNMPEFSPPALPSKPIFALPTVPTFAPIAIPEVPELDIPIFDASVPVDELIEPSTAFDFVELDYSSDLLDSIKAKLRGDLVNGGYGIDPSDEVAIWERARERELKAADAAIEEATTQRAARGFLLPDGALWAAQQIAEQNALDTSSTLSREIAIKRADMYVQARQFAITQSMQLENALIQYSGAKAERALNAAKAQVEVGIALYNLRLEKYKALLESYSKQAQVYETRIRANLSTLEGVKAKIESSNLLLNSQQIGVQIYQSQVDASTKLIELYRTEMEAAQIQAQIEKIKLDGFRTSVEAYGEQVRARETEFKMFEAQIRGETSKIEAYRAAAEAYNSKVNGIKVKAEAEDIVARAQIEENKLLLDQHRTNIDAYRASVEKISLENKSILQRQELGVELDRVLDAKETTRKQTLATILKSNADISTADAELRIKRASNEMAAFIKLQEMAQSGYTEVARARSNVVMAALSQLSGIATQSAS